MLLRPHTDHMMRRLVVVFLALALLLGLAGYLYYHKQKEQIILSMSDTLASIADMKVRQLSAWRRDRIEDAASIAANPLVALAFRSHLNEPRAAAPRENLRSWMRSLQEFSEFQSIILVDAHSIVRMSSNPRDSGIGPHARELIAEALRTRKAILSDFHVVAAANYPHLDLIAPLIGSTRSDAVPFGAVLIRLNADEYLYPLIQSWPGTSRSAETLLVRRDGDSVLYLNELRHRKNSALALRFPLEGNNLPAAMAVQNRIGVFEGIDYRGTPVLAATRSVPQSPWFLVAKVDREEIDGPIRSQARFIAMVAAFLIIAAGLSIMFWWKQKSAEYLREQHEAEVERRALLQRYDYLSKYANDIILLVDQNGRIIEANDRAAAAYGMSRDELLQHSVRDLRPAESQGDFARQFEQVRQQNGLIFETMHQHGDGTVFPVEISARAIDVDGGQYYQAIIRDITDRKKAEIALINEKNRSDAIIAAMGDGISIQDRDFRILYQNQVHKRMIGDYVGEYCFEAYEHRDSTCEGCPVAESFGDGKVHTAERSLESGSGTRHFEITSSPLRDETGAIVAGIEAVRDITSRKKMDLVVLENEKRYKRLVESVTDYIYTVTVENGQAAGTVHGPGCVTVTGFTTEEYARDPDLWYRMIFEEDRNDVLDLVNRILNGISVDPFEHRIIHKNGSIRWVRNTTVLRHDSEGRLIAYDGLISDITQLKLLENQLRQSQKMEAIGQLAGGVAHDFNNILTAIIGYANLLLMKTHKDDPLRVYTEQIISSSERAAHLTNSLLAFSRKQIIDLKPVNLHEVIRRVEKLLGRIIGEDIEFRTRLAPADLTILADSIQIEQVLMNLATNARDAMPDGGTLLIETSFAELGEEYVRIHSYGKPGAYAQMIVSDTGIGMDETTRNRIFEPFFTTKEVGKGTGLGLSMVYGIIKQHNGFINVYSEPGKGTTFKIYLPLLPAASAEQAPERPVLNGSGSETVLLAEDDSPVRVLTKNVLEDFGYSVIEAMDGEDAVLKFKENSDRISLLVLDIIMPRKNGKEAYLEIKKIRPDIKVLFMSGYTANIIHKKGILETGLDFILKPITPTDFLNKIRAVLDRPAA